MLKHDASLVERLPIEATADPPGAGQGAGLSPDGKVHIIHLKITVNQRSTETGGVQGGIDGVGQFGYSNEPTGTESGKYLLYYPY